MKLFRKTKVKKEAIPEVEFTKEELMVAIVVVSNLNANDYDNLKIKALIFKIQWAKDNEADIIVYS